MTWIVLALVALAALGNAQPAVPAEWPTHASEAGWSVRHPPDWRVTELASTGEAVLFAPPESATTSVLVVVQPRPRLGVDAFLEAYLGALEAKHPELQTPLVAVDRFPAPRIEIESWETHPQGERYFSRTFLFRGDELALVEGEFRAPVHLQGEDGRDMRRMIASWSS